MSGMWMATIGCLAGLAGLLVAEYRQTRRVIWLTKPLASTCFIVVATLAGALESTFGTAILVGLVLSWFGDVFLISRARASFLAGLVSFLLGHVAYVVAFVARGVDPVWMAAGVVLVCVVAVVVGRWLLPSVEGGMRRPVIAYITVISAMVAASIGTYALLGNPLVLVGAVMFYLSDLAVARDRFVSTGFINRSWGLPLYYGGQLVLAWAVVGG